MSELARLKWKCRRGMKELDLLLERYLDGRYPAADAVEQEAFRELLDMQDPELFAFVTGRERPAT
jgi:antitoxin CptB